jgi:rubredoxin
MTQWKCSGCGNTFPADRIPAQCPSCKEKCSFSDVSCYTPECGGAESGNIDPRLLQPDPGKKV